MHRSIPVIDLTDKVVSHLDSSDEILFRLARLEIVIGDGVVHGFECRLLVVVECATIAVQNRHSLLDRGVASLQRKIEGL